jgi:RNA polymerase sigma factor (sigma-70 family)
VELARAGSQPAFEVVVERYRASLLKYAGAIAGRDAADEIVQESLVCAHLAIRRGDEVASLRAWLYRIVRNKALNLIRDRGPIGVPLDESHAAFETPEIASERKQTLRQVVDAVNGLPHNQRDAIVLREFEGRSYDEIAGRLGLSDPAVRGLLNRARVTIRRAAAALAPLWPSRLAELWSASAVGNSGAARACATGLVAAVATFGGIGAEGRPDPHRETRAAEPTAAVTQMTEPARQDETGDISGHGDRGSRPPRVQAAVDARTAAPELAAAPTQPARLVEEPAPSRAEAPREGEAEEQRLAPEQRERDRDLAQRTEPPPREPQPEQQRMRTAAYEPPPDDFHKSDVGSLDGDGMRREFHR